MAQRVRPLQDLDPNAMQGPVPERARMGPPQRRGGEHLLVAAREEIRKLEK